MTQREQQRAQVLTQLLHRALVVTEAARLLGLSVRHVRRLAADFRRRGLSALVHGNRGHPSPRRLPDAIRAQVISLARTTYAGLNDHHLTDLLHERHGLRVSRPTVYRTLRAAAVPRPRIRRPPRHRRRRERMPQAGMLVQLDGSHHPWLQARGPWLVLLAAIDDATNRVLAATFRLHEDTHGYFLLLRHLIRTHGVPLAVYTDRLGLFHRDARSPLTLHEQLQGRADLTHIGRALQELGIRWIPASSPQAKGRIERLFGTFQDRLVSELRLARASTLEDANRVLQRFLPRYNRRFALRPADSHGAFRTRPAPAVLEAICCFKYRRVVANDNTIRLEDQLLQLLPGPGGRTYAKARVDVHERLDGTLAVYYQGRPLRSQRLTASPLEGTAVRARHPHHRDHHRIRPARPSAKPPAPEPPRQRFTLPGTSIPTPDHPWRRMTNDDIWRERHRPERTFSLTR